MSAPILIELPYLPPISWCAAVWQRPVLYLESCEHYKKGSWRNRCHIAGPNGLQRLSIPLQKGKHQQTPVREVRIADDDWSLQHWRSIQTAYGNAPYFDYYGPSLQKHFEHPPSLLFDFNLGLLHWAFQQLGYKGIVESTKIYEKPGGRHDFRDALRPGAVQRPAWFIEISYPQVFADRRPFLPDLSVLDLLMCCGKHAGLILERSVKNEAL